jgi:hypothetical protein
LEAVTLRFTISADPPVCCRTMGLMTNSAIKPDDLDALIRACGGLGGLAAQLGPHDLAAKPYEPAANEKTPRGRVGLWRLLLNAIEKPWQRSWG